MKTAPIVAGYGVIGTANDAMPKIFFIEKKCAQMNACIPQGDQ
jgi:hypothetical protein